MFLRNCSWGDEMTIDFDKLDITSKICDLILNGFSNLEGICKRMQKNRKQDPLPYMRDMVHRLYGLTESIAILEEKELAKRDKERQGG